MVDVDPVEMSAVTNQVDGVIIAIADDRLLAHRRPIRAQERDCVFSHRSCADGQRKPKRAVSHARRAMAGHRRKKALRN